jgi:hypothetical protein
MIFDLRFMMGCRGFQKVLPRQQPQNQIENQKS